MDKFKNYCIKVQGSINKIKQQLLELEESNTPVSRYLAEESMKVEEEIDNGAWTTTLEVHDKRQTIRQKYYKLESISDLIWELREIIKNHKV